MMKDFILLDSGVFLKFRAETINTANYLQNRLSTKSQRGDQIAEET